MSLDMPQVKPRIAFDISVEGITENDVAIALEQVRDMILAGFYIGSDSNYRSRYRFDPATTGAALADESH